MLDPGTALARVLGAASRAEARRAWLLLFLLAGCASHPPGGESRVEDWEAAGTTTGTRVPAVPAAPPPPSAAAPLALQPEATLATNPLEETWIPLSRWCKANGLAAPCPLSAASPREFALATTNGVFVLRASSQVAHWDGLEVRMAFAPQMREGQPLVHGLDLKKTIQPLVWGPPMNLVRTNLTIVIDPGHGGEDSGTWSVLDDRYEKEFTLDWARRLGALLAANGWRVFLTRTTDTDLSISNRIAFAEARNPDLFLSLHFNSSAPNDQQAGLETYCLTPTGMPSTVTRGFGDDLAQVFPNNAFDAQNLQLAVRAHRALLRANGRHDRGVRRARFLGVLRGQKCPAILVEGGYLSNPQEARRISDPAYRQRLAEALADTLSGKAEVASRTAGATGSRAELRAQDAANLSTNLLRP